MGYYQFGKKHFEYELRGILIKNKLGYLKDITEEFVNDGHDVWEHIYKVSTKNKAVDIIIFSSLDQRTAHVRESCADAVRVILRWKTGQYFRYRRVAKHYRIDTLFKNLETTLKGIVPFNLNVKEFTPIEEIA